MSDDPVIDRIDTNLELYALPVGAAIRDLDGNILVCDGHECWLEPGGSTLVPELPALVIWHPDWAKFAPQRPVITHTTNREQTWIQTK